VRERRGGHHWLREELDSLTKAGKGGGKEGGENGGEGLAGGGGEENLNKMSDEARRKALRGADGCGGDEGDVVKAEVNARRGVKAGGGGVKCARVNKHQGM
jgi:hypothetical protein